MTSERFLALDGLKGVACIFILISHCQGYLLSKGIWMVQYLWMFNDLFMVLSGFMIAYSYKNRIKSMPLSLFFGKRYFKLMPLYWLTMTINHAMYIIGGLIAGHSLYTERWDISRIILEYLGLYSSIWGKVRYVLNVPGWALNCLLICYVIYYFIRKNVKEESSYVILAVFSLAIVRRVLLVECENYLEYDFFVGSFLFFRVLAAFCIGIIVYELYNVITVTGGQLISAVLCCCFFVGMVITVLLGNENLSVYGTNDYLTGIVFFPPMLILSAIYIKPMNKILENRIFRFLGKISYGIYLWQGIVLNVICSRTINLADSLIGLLVAIGGTIVIAYLSYVYIEPMLHRYVNIILGNIIKKENQGFE